MYKLCKTEQSVRRQRELELGLQSLMLQRRYEDISVSDLCTQMEMPRKSFYRYFSSKEGCLFALVDHTLIEFFQTQLSADAELSGTQIGDLGRYFLFWRERADLLEALQRNGLSGTLMERSMALALRERLMPRYLQGADPHIQQLAMSFSVCGLLSMVIQWHNQGFKTTPEEMTRIAVSILTQPLIQ